MINIYRFRIDRSIKNRIHRICKKTHGFYEAIINKPSLKNYELFTKNRENENTSELHSLSEGISMKQHQTNSPSMKFR